MKSLMTNVANSIHNLSLALLVGISAQSFRATSEAAANGENALPFVMMALTRLSVVLSQLSAMALATAVITIVAAAVQWPRLAIFASATIAACMLGRAASSMFLMSEISGRGSVVALVTSLQTDVKSAPLTLRPAPPACTHAA